MLISILPSFFGRSEVIAATLIPYLKRSHSMGHADRNGSTVVHHQLLEQSLQHGVIDSVEVFLPRLGGSRTSATGHYLHVAQQAVFEYNAQRNAESIRLRQIEDLRDDGEQRRLFLTRAQDIGAIAQSRAALEARFPICGIVHSVICDDFQSVYLSNAAWGQRADKIVATSEAAEKAVRQALETANQQLRFATGKTPESSPGIERIPLGVDHEHFQPSDAVAARRLLSLPEEALTVTYVGRLTKSYKATLEPLLTVCATLKRRHPSLHLLFAGTVEDESYVTVLERVSRELEIGAAVHFITNFPAFVKRLIYAASDIVVLPVDNIQESFGLSVLEAMASGRPVVASDWSGYRDLVVHGENGFLVPTIWIPPAAFAASILAPLSRFPTIEEYLAQHTVVDVEALASYLDVLCGNPDRRQSMGEKGRKRVERSFSWRIVTRLLGNLWQDQVATAKDASSWKGSAAMDCNKLFEHYATSVLSPAARVECTDRGRVAQKTGRSLERGECHVSPLCLRVLAALEARTLTVEEIIADIPDSLSSVVWLLKMGYCTTRELPAKTI